MHRDPYFMINIFKGHGQLLCPGMLDGIGQKLAGVAEQDRTLILIEFVANKIVRQGEFEPLRPFQLLPSPFFNRRSQAEFMYCR